VASSLFISDLHLSEDRPDTNEAFFAFIETKAAAAATLYILGDLFDYWTGDDELDASDGNALARQVAAKLHLLSSAGVAVRLLHGNRDFLIGARFTELTGAMLLPDPSKLSIEGRDYLLTHGDLLCTDDTGYLEFRRLVRSPQWQREFLARPLSERRALMQQLRQRSEAAKRAKAAVIMDANQQAIATFMRTHSVTRLIHGHTHRPQRHEFLLDGAAAERWVLPDWYERGGYLELGTEGAVAHLVQF